MSTITKEFTKEQLIERLQHRISVASGFPESEKAQMDLELARIALASLEAEVSGRNPVLAYADSYRDMAKQGVESIPVWSVITDLERNIAPLYTAPPAPVSVPDEVCWEDVPEEITEDDMALASAWAHGFNQCRAAMLQGAEPVTPAYKSPDDLDFDRFNDVVWLEAVASNPHMHSLTTSTIAMVALELNRKLADCNSPVIANGWVACSERMPENDDFVYIWPRPDFGVELHVAQYGKFDKRDAGWYAQVYEQNYGIEYYPVKVTHWMPLPNSPKE